MERGFRCALRLGDVLQDADQPLRPPVPAPHHQAAGAHPEFAPIFRPQTAVLDFVTPLGQIINKSVNQTLSRTVLTSGTTLLIVTCLLIFGGGMIYDFALIMFIGVLVGTASSIFVASPVLLAFGDSINRQPPTKEDRRPRGSDGRLAPQV